MTEKFAELVVALWRLKQRRASPEEIGEVLADLALVEVPAGEIAVVETSTRFVSEDEAASHA